MPDTLRRAVVGAAGLPALAATPALQRDGKGAPGRGPRHRLRDVENPDLLAAGNDGAFLIP